jgi:nucleoside-diphosphate-sugar epimerase
MLKALITGISGFTGRYLTTELLQSGYKVFGLLHKEQSSQIPGVEAAYVCDLCDTNRLANIIEEVQPDVVIHLAAIAFVAHDDVESIYRTNLLGTRSLLEALVRIKKPLRSLLLASSANVYGNATGGQLSETTLPAPANDYAVSKVAMEYIAKLYTDRLPIIIARPFNYTGLGQSENFLLPKIVNHVRCGAPMIELGNLDVARDFSDVRRIVQYYHRLLETPAAIGETFNVCSGKAYTLAEVLDEVNAISGYAIEVKVNPKFVRENEVKTLIGSCAKLESAVGVAPDISLTETLHWMIEAKYDTLSSP